MSRLTLVFTVCSIIIAGTHFGLAKGDAASDQLESPVDDVEEASERSGQAVGQGNAHSQVNGVGRPRPVNSPYPPNVGPYPPNPSWPINTCYSCAGCSKVDNSSTLVRMCPTYSQIPLPTKCVTYSEKYPNMRVPWVIRGCVAERGSCEEIRRAHNNNNNKVQLLSCSECLGDNCNDKNGAGSAAPNLLIAAIAMLATPILTKISFSKI